jgi:hypothetical protein
MNIMERLEGLDDDSTMADVLDIVVGASLEDIAAVCTAFRERENVVGRTLRELGSITNRDQAVTGDDLR